MNHLESKTQANIVAYLQSRKIFCFSVPNELAGGGSGASKRMMFFITMGLRTGVSDLIVWVGPITIYMEVKTKTGVLSDAQKRFKIRCEESGRIYAVVRSVSDVEALLASYI